MKTIALLVSIVFIVTIATRCSSPVQRDLRAEPDPPPLVEPETPPTVYVAGYRNDGARNVAGYWIDDGETITHYELQPGVAGEATDMHVDANGVVHAVGWYRSGSTDMVAYWDDGVLTTLDSEGRGTGMHKAEVGLVYVSGYYHDGTRNVAVYWVVNGGTVTRVDLHTTSAARATGIAVNGAGVVYASGHYNNGAHDVAVYWTSNGATVNVVELYPTAFSQANAIVIDGGTVYVAGRYLDGTAHAAVWVNDQSGRIGLSSDYGNAKAVIRVSADTVAAGDVRGTVSTRSAVCWNGTVGTELNSSEPGAEAHAFAVAVAGATAYTAGYHDTGEPSAVYWRDCEIRSLSAGVDSKAFSIVVVE